jgi:N-acetylmuramoyl-L-alanine amidase
MQQTITHQPVRAVLMGAAFAVVLLALPTRVDAQAGAAALYERAQTREAAVRKTDRPAVATLRAVAAAYETVVRRYPRSGYADNALWQAGLMYQQAFEQAGQSRDQAQARRVLQWLAREYPTSALSKRAKSQLAAPAASGSVTAAPAPASTPAQAAATAAAQPASRPATRPAPSSSRAPAPVPTAATGTATAIPTGALPNQILPAPVTLTAITVAPLPKGDRLTFELSSESTYTTTRAPKSSFVVFTLPSVGLSTAALATAASIKGALIHSVRLTPKNGGTEIEVRLNGQPRHSTFPLYGPYRLVFDVEGDAPIARDATPAPEPAPAATLVATPPAATPEPVSPVAAALPAAEPVTLPRPGSRVPPASTSDVTSRPITPASTAAGGYSLARQLGLGVSRIVIDPGHGGHDPGAQAHGVSEAELVLDVALRLEKLLQAQPGFEVVLTRRTNEFIALEARTALANKESADLFLSIHANSSPQSDTRGVETYFLNFSSNAHAETVAARENAASAQSMRLLPGLVKAITLNNKRTESREFASMVQAALIKQMKTQNKNVKDLGVKQAPFVVLIGAEMPSVLAEISFITNKADANLLKQQTYRQRVAQALADAVLRYQGSLKKVTAVATTAPAF